MKNKILAIALVVCIAVTAIAGATLAYLQDADKDVNVMTLGNVKIVQNETKRDGTAYEDGLKLYPAVPTSGQGLYKDNTITDTDGTSDVDIWDTSINNEIDKFVSVTNEGTEDAYVRTILLFETVRSYKENDTTYWVDLHDEFFLINGDYDYLVLDPENNPNANADETKFTYVPIGDKEYVIAVKTYEEALAPKATTTASLRQFALTWDAGNEVYDFFGPEYEILALSQAVQVAGFDTLDVTNKAENALNTAFGEVTAENVIKWFGETGIQTTGSENVIPKFPAENN